MHRNHLLFLCVLAAPPALAGSIEHLAAAPLADAPSLVALGCAGCSPSAPDDGAAPSLTRLRLPEGQQIVSITERHGQKALLRTEAWMGGSPVTFVSLNPLFIGEEERIMALRQTPAPTLAGDGVDAGTTAAVAPDAARPSPALSDAPVSGSATPPGFSGFELRLDH